MSATVKCNITHYTLEKMSAIFYGLNCGKSNDLAILENYIEFLDCSTIKVTPCYLIECENPVTVFNCNFNIKSINLEREGNLFTYSVAQGTNFFGGTAPFTYEWSFTPDIFDIVSEEINTDTIQLQLKDQFDPTTIVAYISVAITDSNGCTDTKQCWFNQGSMVCNSSFVPCLNTSNLIINSD